MITLEMIANAVRSNFAMVPKEKRAFPYETADVIQNMEDGSGTPIFSELESSKTVGRAMIAGLASIYGIHKDDVVEFLSCDEDQYDEYIRTYKDKRLNSTMSIRPRDKKKFIHGKRYQTETDARFNIKHVLCVNHIHMQEKNSLEAKFDKFKTIVDH